MNNIEDIYKSICYMEEHLKEPITIMDAARSAGYSIFHFSRLFNAVTGHSPYDYIMRRRLSEAAKDIRDFDSRVTDIAFDYQFNSLETFSRAFKKMFRIPPNKFKNPEYLGEIVLKAPLTLDYLYHINCNAFFKPSLVEIEEMLLLGEIISGFPSHSDLQKIPRLIERIQAVNVGSIKDLNSIYTVSFHTGNWECDRINRVLGVRTESLECIPDKYVGKKVPAGVCIELLHNGSKEELGHTYDYIFQTWLPLSGYSAVEPYTIENFSEDGIVYENTKGIRIMVPVKKNGD